MNAGHEAARSRSARDFTDAPVQQPMRPAARGEIARNPSSDQKRVRRQNQRTADYTPGHVECASCGYVGHPVLGDGTGKNCAQCGSYSVQKVQHGYKPAPTYPENSMDITQRTLEQQRPGHAAAKTATIVNTRAELLNPGDAISMPNGRTQKVLRVRPHETFQAHVYVDTDAGTTTVHRSDAFQVVPHNARQQELPGYGTPGGNTNRLPGDPSGASNAAPSSQCPTCGRGQLVRQGDHYTCSRCGFREQFGGAGGYTFSDSPRQVQVGASRYSTVNGSTMSAVARRAAALLSQEEDQ